MFDKMTSVKMFHSFLEFLVLENLQETKLDVPIQYFWYINQKMHKSFNVTNELGSRNRGFYISDAIS